MVVICCCVQLEVKVCKCKHPLSFMDMSLVCVHLWPHGTSMHTSKPAQPGPVLPSPAQSGPVPRNFTDVCVPSDEPITVALLTDDQYVPVIG